MEFKQIKELMAAMNRLQIDEVSWREKDSQIQLKRSPPSFLTTHNEEKEHFSSHPEPDGLEQIDPSMTPKAKSALSHQMPLDNSHWIVSPMIGTLYLTPSPKAPPFANVGDRVDESSVVCIVEAMKVMNEVRAPMAGTIAEIAVNSGSAVEFGTQLIRIAAP